MTEQTRVLPIRKQNRNSFRPLPAAVVVGKVVHAERGEIRVDFPGNPHGPIAARLTSAARLQLDRNLSAGTEVLLCFEGGEASRPIIVDTIAHPSQPRDEGCAPETVGIVVDGKRMVVDAAEEVVLRCGKASITLNKSGKVLIKGEYVISRASGTQCIQGGSIRIN